MTVKLPTISDRTVVLGRTGTGKTVAGLWHLSNYNLSTRPWVALDFKRDDHLNSIQKAQYIDWDEIPGRHDDGLFIVHALPSDTKGTSKEPAIVDTFLKRLWERENIGIFIDEAYAVGNCEGLELCLTQGRSKHIPMIICSQRPAWISRFCFSEASFVQCFALTDSRDYDTVEMFMPIDFADVAPLAKHQSFYYNVADHKICRLNPVPDMKRTLETFDKKLTAKRARI